MNMKKFLVAVIDKYQKIGGGERMFSVECNYTPSCSEYTKQAIVKYGAIKGLIIGFKRIRRCTDKNLTKKIIDNIV